jgi:hypothetical protein
MKIHKINLENNYRNLMLDALQKDGGKSYNRQPIYSDVVVKPNEDGSLVLALPSLPVSYVMSVNSIGQFIPTTVQYATASIVGIESTKSIPLNSGFSLGLDRERVYWTTENQPTLKLYTIPANVDKVKVVISFKSGRKVKTKVGNRIQEVWKDLVSNDSIDAMTIVIQRKDNSFAPVTIIDAETVDLDALVARVEALEAASNTSNG